MVMKAMLPLYSVVGISSNFSMLYSCKNFCGDYRLLEEGNLGRCKRSVPFFLKGPRCYQFVSSPPDGQ